MLSYQVMDSYQKMRTSHGLWLLLAWPGLGQVQKVSKLLESSILLETLPKKLEYQLCQVRKG